MGLLTTEQIDTDVLVIGGGGAGLRAAIAAATQGVRVVLVSQSRAGYANNTAIAAGNMCVLAAPEDTPEAYFEDTLSAGRFINDRRLVRLLVEGSKRQTHELEELGVVFKKEDGKLVVSRVPGHSHPRCVAVINKGMGLTMPLRAAALAAGVKLLEGVLVTRLVGEAAVQGAIGIDEKGKAFVINARAVVLASGGLGQLYSRTSTAIGSTGDGYVLAYEAGAPLQDMEMVQFYPTATTQGATSRLILYESLVGQAGGIIRNSLDEDVVKKHGLEEPGCMTRDRLARAMMTELIEGRDIQGALEIDLSCVPEEAIPQVKDLLPARAGAKGELRIPVTPVAHFQMGGVRIDDECRTALPGLFAAGEVCGGVHGANRLGGNSLAEIFVFGRKAGLAAASRALETAPMRIAESRVDSELQRLWALMSPGGECPLVDLLHEIKTTMWSQVGIVRSGSGLSEALKALEQIRIRLGTAHVTSPPELTGAIRIANMITVAEMVTRSALLRTESRGAHYRTDYPEENNAEWQGNVVLSKRGEGMVLEKRPLA